MRNKIGIAIFAATASLVALSTTAMADLSGGFARTEALYGDKAPSYERKVTEYEAEDVTMIHCPPEDAVVYTDTHVRTNPSHEVPYDVIILPDSMVKVRGYSNNDWCRVWVKTPDGVDHYGWIRSDLLNPADWSSGSTNAETEAAQAEAPTTEATSTEIQIQSEQPAQTEVQAQTQPQPQEQPQQAQSQPEQPAQPQQDGQASPNPQPANPEPAQPNPSVQPQS